MTERRERTRAAVRACEPGHHSVAPCDLRLAGRLSRLECHPPRVVIRREEPHQRINEHQSTNTIGVSRGERDRHRRAVPVRQEHRPLGADHIEHRDEVAHCFLEPWTEVAPRVDRAKGVREPRAAGGRPARHGRTRPSADRTLRHRHIRHPLDRCAPTARYGTRSTGPSPNCLVRDQPVIDPPRTAHQGSPTRRDRNHPVRLTLTDRAGPPRAQLAWGTSPGSGPEASSAPRVGAGVWDCQLRRGAAMGQIGRIPKRYPRPSRCAARADGAPSTRERRPTTPGACP